MIKIKFDLKKAHLYKNLQALYNKIPVNLNKNKRINEHNWG